MKIYCNKHMIHTEGPCLDCAAKDAVAESTDKKVAWAPWDGQPLQQVRPVPITATPAAMEQWPTYPREATPAKAEMSPVAATPFVELFHHADTMGMPPEGRMLSCAKTLGGPDTYTIYHERFPHSIAMSRRAGIGEGFNVIKHLNKQPWPPRAEGVPIRFRTEGVRTGRTSSKTSRMTSGNNFGDPVEQLSKIPWTTSRDSEAIHRLVTEAKNHLKKQSFIAQYQPPSQHSEEANRLFIQMRQMCDDLLQKMVDNHVRVDMEYLKQYARDGAELTNQMNRGFFGVDFGIHDEVVLREIKPRGSRHDLGISYDTTIRERGRSYEIQSQTSDGAKGTITFKQKIAAAMGMPEYMFQLNRDIISEVAAIRAEEDRAEDMARLQLQRSSNLVSAGYMAQQSAADHLMLPQQRAAVEELRAMYDAAERPSRLLIANLLRNCGSCDCGRCVDKVPTQRIKELQAMEYTPPQVEHRLLLSALEPWSLHPQDEEEAERLKMHIEGAYGPHAVPPPASKRISRMHGIIRKQPVAALQVTSAVLTGKKYCAKHFHAYDAATGCLDCDPIAAAEPKRLECAYCGKTAQGNYAIHRDGFGEGPEVDLCDGCGNCDDTVLSCEQIWAKISQTDDSGKIT